MQIGDLALHHSESRKALLVERHPRSRHGRRHSFGWGSFETIDARAAFWRDGHQLLEDRAHELDLSREHLALNRLSLEGLPQFLHCGATRGAGDWTHVRCGARRLGRIGEPARAGEGNHPTEHSDAQNFEGASHPVRLARR
jgi:hypothetical protein